MQKIVITQPMGLTDEQLEELRGLGGITYYDSISKDTNEWLDRVANADIIYSNNYGLDDGWRSLKDKYITYPFVTTAFLDMDALRANHVLVSNSPGCNQIAVTEWIIAMLLNYSRRFPQYIKTNEIHGPIPPTTKSIYGKSVCVVGRGTIGSRCGKALEALGMSVDYYTRNDVLAEKISGKDFIVDCLSLNPSTKEFYNAGFFELCRDGVVFVAISPNGTQNLTDIYAALESGKIDCFITDNAAALIFNVKDEMYGKLKQHPKIIVTPHVAAYSDNTLATASRICIDNIKAYIEGRPINLVYEP
jgi:glycerate dehydrogenase